MLRRQRRQYVRNAHTSTRTRAPALVPAIIGYGDEEGCELFKKMALCTIVTRLDAPTWKRKSSVSIFFVACLSWNSPPTARKGAALLCVFENIVARRDSCMRDNDRKLVALTCARSFAIDGENKSCDEYFSLRFSIFLIQFLRRWIVWRISIFSFLLLWFLIIFLFLDLLSGLDRLDYLYVVRI